MRVGGCWNKHLVEGLDEMTWNRSLRTGLRFSIPGK